MDDLEHSVFIAEQEWNSFCEESEECSIQQAGLADQDDSSLSDTDDDKCPTQESVLPLQTKPDKPSEEKVAAAQTQEKAEDCDVRDPFKDSGCFSCETDRGRHAEQISLNDNISTYACLTTDCIVCGSDMAPSDQQHKTSDTENGKDPHECHNEGKIGQATGELVTSTSAISIQDTGGVGRSEVTMVMGSSATPKKEKERWFVTVNDSPVHLRIHHGTPGQKKRRKKKRSRKLDEQSGVTKRPCTFSNIEKEAVKEEINTVLSGNGNEEVISGLTNFQKVGLAPIKEPEAEDCENSSVTNCILAVHPSAHEVGNLNCADVPTDKPENICSISVNYPAPLIIAHSLQLQNDVLNGSMTQFAYDQSTAGQRESSTDITTHAQPVKEYLTHFHKEVEHPCLSENQESSNESLEPAVSPSHPIYALSSFWDEMEKLTINDILHLRVANDTSPLKENVNPEESDFKDRCLVSSKDMSLQDSSLTDDTADSDYFTHLDDSKPDCSSCEFSTFSDFDEEFLQTFNASAHPSPEPQNVKGFTNIQEEEFDLTLINNKNETENIIMLCPQEGIPLYLCPGAEAECSFLASDQDSSGSLFEWEAFRKTPSPILSVVDSLDDQYLLTVSEIFTKDIGEGLETRSLDGHSSVISFPYSQNLSVPETYDDFFSDFEVANLFFPSVQDKTIPIFSSLHSVVRDLVLPEVEELSESDTENENSQIQVMTRFSSHSPNFDFFTNWRRNWRSLLSLRRNTFIGKGSTWCRKISAWIFPQQAKEKTSYVSKVQSVSPLLPLEGKALVQFVEQQEHLQHAVSISTRDDFSIGQADMCLVCIAFASWLLKSSNPQSADMWKAALLANVSAISAIQYLRQYVKRETTNYDP